MDSNNEFTFTEFLLLFPLTPDSASIARPLWELGIEAFGLPNKFSGWLLCPNFVLGWVKPIELLHSSEGRQQLRDALYAIIYGAPV